MLRTLFLLVFLFMGRTESVWAYGDIQTHPLITERALDVIDSAL